MLDGHGTRNQKATAAIQVTVLQDAPQSFRPSQPTAQTAGTSAVRSILPPAVRIGNLTIATGQQTAETRSTNPTLPSVRPIQGQSTTMSAKDGPGDHETPKQAERTSSGSPSLQAPVRPVNQDAKQAAPAQPANPRAAGQSVAVLTVSGTEFRVAPAHPKAKEPIEFVIPVHNIGRADANRAKIICSIAADGRVSFMKEFDAEIKAGQVYIVRLGAETPAAREIVLEVIVRADGASEHAVSRASISVSVGADPPRRR
jgi:hypothetical protein